ncbi:BtrH N-terminal domain-containing protein [Bordetella sp. BOR01]|uniref:BtrH N-terminal domain-containing protein n=1 Tax=Bordetella sp. BOR01 TaxID=2854779 RepID=UPI001C493B08|nr:BtrH N-terminal domain-containing protein [Bordetella sp. BOR01]MBV7483483.1 BtrH N-terminal domain-containing protein [Bordetella sp. BOR01]
MPEISTYASSYYSMTWLGPKGYPENGNAGRCYFTGVIGMLNHVGESDALFADGTSGDGFSFRWCPAWGAPAFNGGKGAFHEIWEYTPRILGYRSHWTEDPEGGFDEAFAQLTALIDRGVPVQVGLHYSLLLPYGAASSPRLAFMKSIMQDTGFGHHVVVAGYDLQRKVVTLWEPNDLAEHARYECPVDVFRQAWEQASLRTGDQYRAWPHHHPWGGQWSLHDGYGPYLMVWVEPGRDPDWNIAAAIRDSYRRNLKILNGDYPKPYALFGNQWQIPHWETGAPGMARFAEAVLAGQVCDPLSPTGERKPLFVNGSIPNHGVLGRRAASGYLRRVASELGGRGFDATPVSRAAELMDQSSTLFRQLRYESDMRKAGLLVGQIAAAELAALSAMKDGWASVRQLDLT